jgi:hypothetical protein
MNYDPYGADRPKTSPTCVGERRAIGPAKSESKIRISVSEFQGLHPSRRRLLPSGPGSQLGQGFYRIKKRFRLLNAMNAFIFKDLVHFYAPQKTPGGVKVGEAVIPTQRTE